MKKRTRIETVLTNTENKQMNDNITLKEPNTKEFNLAFDNFYNANPTLKNEAIMYMFF